MALKKSSYKLQSSLATYIFVTRDLDLIFKDYDWHELTKLDDPIIRKEKDFTQLQYQTKLFALSCHLEIMHQAFYEHIKKLAKSSHSKYLDDLGWFLLNLRNAFNHTRGELIPRWDDKIKLESSIFSIKIPYIKEKEGYRFNLKAESYYKLSWFGIKPKKKINVNDKFLFKIWLLSYHILEIVKKQKIETLDKYLKGINDLHKRIY